VRWSIRTDLLAILEIERESFEFPWRGEDFKRCSRCSNVVGMTCENRDRQTVGFMIYELHKCCLHVLNFAVHPQHRNNGAGSAMVEKLISKVDKHLTRHKVTLMIRETNLPAQLFFSRHGFLATRVLENEYQDTSEDAYWFEYDTARQPSVVV